MLSVVKQKMFPYFQNTPQCHLEHLSQFMVYGTVHFIPYDITSLSFSPLVFEFGRELFMFTNIFWTVLDPRNNMYDFFKWA